jgi:hypothetical protein
VEPTNELGGAAAQKLLNQFHFHLARIGKTHHGLMFDKSVVSDAEHYRRFGIIAL